MNTIRDFLLAALLPVSAAAAVPANSGGHAGECYDDRPKFGGSYTVVVTATGKEQYCIPINKACNEHAVDKIREDWVGNHERKMVPMQVYLALKLKYCKVEESDFVVPHDSLLRSLEQSGREVRAVFSSREGNMSPCVAQVWPKSPFANGATAGETIYRPYSPASASKCDWLTKIKLPPIGEPDPDWIAAHNRLIDMNLLPKIGDKNLKFPTDLSRFLTFDVIDIPAPPPKTTTRDPPTDPTASGRPIRDVGFAGAGALLLLFARWLREFLLSRRKASPVASERIASSDVTVRSRWAGDADAASGATLGQPDGSAPR